MILTFDELSNIVLNNPNRDLILRAQKRCKTLRMHLHGEGMAEHLKVIPGFEKQWMRDLRVMYTRTNEDIFERLGRPTDKVFDAKGGSVYYNLPESQEKKAATLSDDARDGYSVREWIENFWHPHYQDDPCGVIMLEILPQHKAIIAKQKGHSFVYPTYKSSLCIHDYDPKGVHLEYISFQLDKGEKLAEGYTEEDNVFRVVDDAKDYYVLNKGNYIVIDEARTINNFFGTVPVMINSDIVDPICKNSFMSIYNKVVKLADEFLLKGSIKVTSDFRHGFPKYAEYANDCNMCNGEGYVEGEKCTECKGSGKAARVYVSDTKLLPYPTDKDAPVVKPADVGAYVEPSKVYHEISISDMTMLENYMTLTMWGTQSKIQTNGMSVNDNTQRTATDAMMEVKPEAARLVPISKSAEKRHKFILDHMIRLQVAMNYTGSTVSYGRRYMFEGPDALWEKYADSRAKGVAISALDDQFREYLEARFSSDPIKLSVHLKLMKVEPFIHYKATDVIPFRLDPETYKAKIFYGDWLAEQSTAILYASDAQELRLSLYEYAAKKKLEEPVKEPIPA
jgi:hypothetical protein